MVYREWLEQWLTAKLAKVKESSYSSYKINIDTHIIPLLGDKEVEEIDEDMLQDVLDLMEKSGNRKTGLKLSEKTIKEVIRLIKTTIKAYCKKYKIPTPFFNELEYARSGGSSCEVFTKEEQRKLLTVVIKSKKAKAVGVGLGLLEGMRIGEISALKWDDIDMDEQIIEVRGTLQRIYRNSEGLETKSQIVIGTPKTTNSQRTIPFGTTLRILLQAIIPDSPEGKYVLTGTEKPMEPRTLRAFYYKLLKENGLRKLKFHSLRHTFGTKCITCGIDPATLCKIMGHANPTITINLYCHPGLEDMKNAIKEVDSTWLKTKEKEENTYDFDDIMK